MSEGGESPLLCVPGRELSSPRTALLYHKGSIVGVVGGTHAASSQQCTDSQLLDSSTGAVVRACPAFSSHIILRRLRPNELSVQSCSC
jgi:hypothetical protein